MNSPADPQVPARTADDVRNDPQVGDVIKQNGSYRIQVIKREGDTVEWHEGKAKKWNSWSISGWRNVVCRGAQVVTIAGGSEND